MQSSLEVKTSNSNVNLVIRHVVSTTLVNVGSTSISQRELARLLHVHPRDLAAATKWRHAMDVWRSFLGYYPCARFEWTLCFPIAIVWGLYHRYEDCVFWQIGSSKLVGLDQRWIQAHEQREGLSCEAVFLSTLPLDAPPSILMTFDIANCVLTQQNK